MTCAALLDFDPAVLAHATPAEATRLARLLAVVERSTLPLIDWAARFLRHRLTTYDPESPTLGLSDFHRDLAFTLDGLTHAHGRKECRLAPRGSGKTTLANIAFPLREALEGRRRYIVISSDNQDNAEGFLDIIKRELETNLTLRAAYPHAVGVGSKWASDKIRLQNGADIEAVGTGKPIRGRLMETRPDLLIADDLQGKKHAISKAERTYSLDWFNTDFLPMRDPGANVLVLGTARHKDFVVNRLRTTPGWNARLFKAWEGGPEKPELWDEWANLLADFGDPGREARAREFYDANRAGMDAGYRLLWPERFPLYYLMCELQTIGLNAFRSEYLNDPHNPEGTEFPPEYFDDEQRPEFWFKDWSELPGAAVKTIGLDPSKGARDGAGDYSVFILFARDASGVEWVEADMYQGSSEATTDAIIRKAVHHCKGFDPEAIGFEAVLFQQLYGRLLRQAFNEHQVETRLEPMIDSTPKDVRIRRLTTPLAQRRLRFRRTRWTVQLVEQLREFPLGEHDDGPDALEMARRLAIQLYNGRAAGEQGPRQFRA